MRIIITGSDGFIGTHLKEYLVSEGHEVFCFDRSRGIDLCKNKVNFPKADVIYHLAATNGTKHFYNSPSNVLKNNTLLNFVFDDYMEKYPQTEFFFSSTCEIFNGAVDVFDWPVPTDETVPAVFHDTSNPRWSYSMPKIIGENYLLNRYSNVKIIRYFNIFGEKQKDHFISEFVSRCSEKHEIELYGDDTRAFCHVADAAKMTAALCGKSTGVYNIGCPNEYRVSDVARKILKILGMNDKKLIIHPSPIGSVSRRCPDVSKILNEIGEFNFTPFEQALEKTVKWYLENDEY